AETAIPWFQAVRRRRRYRCNVARGVDKPGEGFGRGLVGRRRRVYVPRAVVVANWAKAALNAPAAWPWMRRFAAQVTPTLEREIEALGRHDQLAPASQRHSASNPPTNAAAIEPATR